MSNLLCITGTQTSLSRWFDFKLIQYLSYMKLLPDFKVTHYSRGISVYLLYSNFILCTI